MNWILTPVWSERLIAAVALGLLALAGVRRWREGRGGGPLALRALAIGGLALVLLNPQAPLPGNRPGSRSW